MVCNSARACYAATRPLLRRHARQTKRLPRRATRNGVGERRVRKNNELNMVVVVVARIGANGNQCPHNAEAR